MMKKTTTTKATANGKKGRTHAHKRSRTKRHGENFQRITVISSFVSNAAAALYYFHAFYH